MIKPTKTELKAIKELFQYLHEAEYEHYEECDTPNDHIYNRYMTVVDWLRTNGIEVLK